MVSPYTYQRDQEPDMSAPDTVAAEASPLVLGRELAALVDVADRWRSSKTP
jgi:hypothetical protein